VDEVTDDVADVTDVTDVTDVVVTIVLGGDILAILFSLTKMAVIMIIKPITANIPVIIRTTTLESIYDIYGIYNLFNELYMNGDI
jgi:hypothetical protein